MVIKIQYSSKHLDIEINFLEIIFCKIVTASQYVRINSGAMCRAVSVAQKV